MTDDENAVIGRIPVGEADTTLGGETPPLRVSRRRQRQHAEPSAKLSKGAWLRLITSGGIVFRTSETTVFDDGRLTYRSSPTAVYGQTLLARELTESQLAELRAAVEALDFDALATLNTRSGRDTMVYELTVRFGRKTYAVEASQGTVPEQLSSVLHQLGELVRVGADELNG